MQIDYGSLIQNLGLALLTIFIPIGIYIFSGNNSILDKKIIVKHIVKGERIFLGIVLVYVPLFFWKSDLFAWAKLIICLLISSGFVLIIIRLFSCYKWVIKDNKHDIRLEFISRKDLDKPTLFECWKDIWSIKNLNIKEESDFFDKFIEVIDSYLPKDTIDDLDVVLKLLDYFNSNIEKRNLSYITNIRGNFSIILEWHMLAWERDYHYLTTEDIASELWSKHSEVLRVLNSIVESLTRKILTNGFSYPFFQTLKNHIEKYQSLQKVKDNRIYLYLESFHIFTILFENISKSPDSYDIWGQYFPDEWKITVENFKNNLFVRIMINRYLEWTQERIYQNKDSKYDKELDNTTYNLFPEADPATFSDILFFLIKPWSKNRVKDFLETDKIFGHTGRIYSAYVDDGDNFEENYFRHHQQTISETIKLVCTIFAPQTFISIGEYISEAEKLKGSYDNNGNLEAKRKRIIVIFNEIKIYLNKKNAKNRN